MTRDVVETLSESSHHALETIDDPLDMEPEHDDDVLRLTRDQADWVIECTGALVFSDPLPEPDVDPGVLSEYHAAMLDAEGPEGVRFAGWSWVDDRLCGVMRCAVHDGADAAWVADRHGLPRAVVEKHVYDDTKACHHDVGVDVPRVER